ncbi:hypothetical protein Q9Q94_05135 [Uliginosibacterium sp. 31-16]|uniref:hypothetical protein n=1 Tax=Uliginosibacterium sp. 31-16 TaxID=3068315 RepID=UPI00273E671A|nr:hypothetical protein [Uliginosibacterium sp. 31-16]MDP5238901.1 hypothetical protein [Uliginosibacterium sp. 31-16]
MSELEDHKGDALLISTEVARMLVALGVDWNDEAEMRAIAREALAYHGTDSLIHLAPEDIEGRAKQKLFGLTALMLRTMEEGAELGDHIHGSEIWKALAKALWAEKEAGHQ